MQSIEPQSIHLRLHHLLNRFRQKEKERNENTTVIMLHNKRSLRYWKQESIQVGKNKLLLLVITSPRFFSCCYYFTIIL